MTDVPLRPRRTVSQLPPSVEEPPTAAVPVPVGFLTMAPDDDDAPAPPTDGKVIEITDGLGAIEQVVWRRTRKYENHRWVEDGFWAKRNAGGARAPFEAVAWRAVKGGLYE